MSVLNQLTAMFQEVFDNPELTVTPETGPDQIQDWDSVAQVKLVLAFEEAFGIRLTTDEVAGIHRVSDFIAALNKRKGVSA